MADSARSAGWTADEVPMSDGGEGLLLVLGGTRQTTVVTGPLGAQVEAEWRLLGGPADDEPLTAVIEMSRAAGRALLPRPRGDDPVRASTTGVGQLLLAARAAGARRIVIGSIPAGRVKAQGRQVAGVRDSPCAQITLGQSAGNRMAAGP